MRLSIALAAALLAATIASGASALPVELKGKAADKFIDKYFPNANFPGPTSGRFRYRDPHGRPRVGHADCDVPAMGARSDGAVDTCTVWY
jgi:hypothetical protein